MTTPRKPRPGALAAATPITPVSVSDETSKAVFGLEGPAFNRFLIGYGVKHSKIGRRRVALVADVVAVLDRLASAPAIDDADEVPDAELAPSPRAPKSDEPETADAVLAMLGRKTIAVPPSGTVSTDDDAPPTARSASGGPVPLKRKA